MILQPELSLLADAFHRKGPNDAFFRGAAYAFALSWGLNQNEVIEAVIGADATHEAGCDYGVVDTDLLRCELYRLMATWEVGTMSQRVVNASD